MYEWHGKKYWGAAHGLAGIMHVLMHTDLMVDEQDDVKNTLRYMIKNRFPSGNYPSSEGNESDRLVHWCHGAPGVALTLAKAYEVIACCSNMLLSLVQCLTDDRQLVTLFVFRYVFLVISQLWYGHHVFLYFRSSMMIISSNLLQRLLKLFGIEGF